MANEKHDAIANAVAQGKQRTVNAGMEHWKPRLEAFLAAHDDGHGIAEVADLHLPGDGGSSGTVLFSAQYRDGSVEKFVLRYEAETGHAHESNIVGQYHILDALARTEVPAPRVLGLDEHGEYFGVPGFLMRHIEGTVLPSTYPVNGPLFDATPASRRQMIEDALAALATIHRVDWEGLNLLPHTRQGRGDSWLERDLDWYLTALQWGSPEAVPAMQPVLDWLLAHQFESAVRAFAHGDSSLHNYMYRDGRLVAVLDWEYAFVGTPEVDLAFQMMAHEMLSLDRPPLEGLPDAGERRAIYEKFAGRTLDQWDYYLTIGSLKLYSHMSLAFRGESPAMQAARKRYVGHALSRLMENWEAAKR